ncbi:MAG: hypothetical protein K1X94_36155 [Sandaracinaceae bacterium]|nr:hypothetical protein [Sandaracinaceae bacterium]
MRGAPHKDRAPSGQRGWRLGILGPTDDEDTLREAASFLLGDAEADQVVFLGDGAFLEGALERWAADVGLDGGSTFLDRALAAARSADARTIEQFLAEDAGARRIVDVRRLPDPPARAIELLDDRIVLFVHDKAVLDEEDIANANVIVYGVSKEAQLHRFGKRAFFTPGPLAAGRVGILESSDEGFSVAVYDVSGMPVLRESLATAITRVTVSS